MTQIMYAYFFNTRKIREIIDLFVKWKFKYPSNPEKLYMCSKLRRWWQIYVTDCLNHVNNAWIYWFHRWCFYRRKYYNMYIHHHHHHRLLCMFIQSISMKMYLNFMIEIFQHSHENKIENILILSRDIQECVCI